MALTKISTGMLKQDAASSDLNIDAGTLYLDVSNNRVGIANTSPSQALDVTGNIAIGGTIVIDSNKRFLASDGAANVPYISFAADTNTGLYRPGADTLGFSTAGSERMRIDSSGRVGIGVTSVSSSLHVYHATDNNLARFQSGDATAHIQFRDSNTTYIPSLGAVGDDLTFSVGNGAPERVRINTSGNVGIGVTSPGSRLHVYHASTDTIANFESGDTGVAVNFTASDNSMQIATSSTDGILKNNGSGALRLFNNGSERMRIDSSGRVGIGTTSPNYLLDVEGTGATIARLNSTSGAAVLQISVPDTTSINDINFGDSGSTTSGQIRYRHNGDSLALSTAGTERMRIDSSGRVGIGTTSPTQKLDIRNSGSAAAIKLRREDTSNEMLILIGSSYGYVQNTTGPLGLGGSGGDRDLFIATNGNVGIGTTSPAEELEISADAPSIQLESTNASGRSYGFQSMNTGKLGIYDADAGLNRIVLDSNGNVGIGTTSPAAGAKLHLSSTVGAPIYIQDSNATSTFNITELSNNGGNFGIQTRNSSGTFVSTDYQIVKDANGAQYQRWFTAGSERMRIDASGNFFVGGTSATGAGERTTIYGDVSNSAYPVVAVLADTSPYNSSGPRAGGGIGFAYKYNTVGSTAVGAVIQGLKENSTSGDYAAALTFRTRANGANPVEHMRIDSSGNVDLYQGNNLTWRYAAGSTIRGSISIDSADNITFSNTSSNTERMRIATNGDWVVSNTNPRVVSQFTNQAGIGWYDADLHAEIGTTNNRSALEVGRNNATSGDVITIRQQSASVGMIGTEGGDSLVIQSNGATGSGIRFHPSRAAVEPVRAGVTIDDTISLGADTRRFKDLNLSGTVNAASLNIDGGTIKLDGNYPTGTDNVALGNNTLSSSTGPGNIAIGDSVLPNITSTGSNAVAIGRDSMGTGAYSGGDAVAIGRATLQDLTSGSHNVAIGAQALTNTTTGAYNIGIGVQSLFTNTVGGRSIGIGYQTLYDQDPSSAADMYNIAIGFGTAANITTGVQNTAIGALALDAATTASNNTAVGMSALSGATTGGLNVAIGRDAMKNSTTATENVAVGVFALDAVTTTGSQTAVGYRALSASTTGVSNTAVGHETMQSSTTGQHNTALGRRAMQNSTDADGNIAIGNFALSSSESDYNTVVGYNGMTSNTTGAQSVAIGAFALDSNTTGNYNVGVGYGVLTNSSTASDNTAMGLSAGNSVTTGARNTLIGRSVAEALTTGSDNIYIGYVAGVSATTGNYNTAIGREAFRTQSTASYNTGLGYRVGYANTTGQNNVFVGYAAGDNNTTGSFNTFLGTLAGDANTEGASNVVVGYAAFDANTTGNNNTVVGTYTLTDNTTGTANTAIGRQAGGSNTTGQYSTLIGYQAGYSQTTLGQNTHVGFQAGYYNTSAVNMTSIGYRAAQGAQGANTTAIGTQAMYSAGSGDANTAVGVNSLFANTSGSNNVGVGLQALRFNTTGIRHVAIGNNTLYSNTSGNYGVAVGYEALKSDASVEESVAVGAFALQSQTSGRNTAVGYAAGLDLTTGGYNTLLGGEAGENITTGGQNVAVGTHALRLNQTHAANTAVGYQALYSNTQSDNTAVGQLSLYSNTVGRYNTAVGKRAGQNLSTTNYNTAIGFDSQRNATSGASNTSIGAESLYQNQSDNQVAVGYRALYSATTGGANIAVGERAVTTLTTGTLNVAVGNNALRNVTTSSRNTAMGYNAGDAITTGLNNTVIGADALSTNQTGNHNVAIGRAAMQSTATGISGNVAIGIDTLETAQGSYNTGVGYRALQASNTSNNVGIGHEAGLKVTSGKVTAVGSRALHENTTGTGNVALGEDVAYYNTTGSYNVAIGNAASQANTTGDRNVHIGQQAGEYNTGLLITAVGNQAGQGLVNNTNAGSYSTFIGAYAGQEINTGQLNTFIGYAAGQEVTTGGRNTLIGRYDGNQNGLDIRTSNNNVILSDGDGNIRFHTNSSGNTGIGGIVNSSYKLHVGGAINIDATTEDSSITGGLVTRTPAYSEYHFSVASNQSHTIEMTCGSYFMAIVEYMSFQTNGGGHATEGIQEYHRGVWANNHTTHTWNELESSGSTSAVTNSITVGQNTTTNSGKLTIGITYGSGSYSGSTIVLKVYFGDTTFAISRS